MKTKSSLSLKTIAMIVCMMHFLVSSVQAVPARQFYQLLIYHVKDKTQEKSTDVFLAQAWLPALHRAGLKQVGIFKTLNIDTATDKKIYVLTAYQSLAQFHKISKLLAADQELKVKGAGYIDAKYDAPPFIRKEVILMEAFAGMPMWKTPEFTTPRSERIYELRSYESATEKLYQNKVHMFNEGDEMKIFERIGAQPLFYGEVLAGSRMPNLMYMTTYSDKKSREEHWKLFGNDPEWKRLSALPEYQHNMQKADINFLTPTEYSDF
jgi:hypothetical protein